MNQAINQRPKKVTVIVAGLANTRKTTLARAMHEWLQSTYGIPSQLTDPDGDVKWTAEEQQSSMQGLSENVRDGHIQLEITSLHLPYVGASSYGSSNAQGIEAMHQRGLLVEAIDKFLRRAGVIDKKAQRLTGADCLFQLEMFGQHLAEQQSRKE